MNKISLILAAWYPRIATIDEALEAWKSGKDFKIVGGSYCSIRDFDLLKTRFNKIDLLTVLGTVTLYADKRKACILEGKV